MCSASKSVSRMMCANVRVDVCLFTCSSLFMFCLRACMCVRLRLCACACVRVCIKYTYACVCVAACAHMHVCVRVHVCVHVSPLAKEVKRGASA